MCFFFTNYITVTRDHHTRRGFLEYLLPLYQNVSHDSPLSVATSALAITFTSIWARRGQDSELARRFSGRALALIKAAIDDPMQNTTDDTLMTVLLLEFHESVSGTIQSRPSSGVHQSGAVALVKHRGSLNFESEISRRLLIAVRHQLIVIALQRGESVPPDPAVWTNGAPMPENPAIALDELATDLANLNAFVKSVDFRSPPPTQSMSRTPSPTSFNASGSSIKILHSLLAPALHLDARLSQWLDSLPTYWYPISVSSPSCLHMSVAEAGLYGSSCDIYPSLPVAGIWNSYRTTRIATLKIILVCQQSLTGLNSEADSSARRHYAADSIQRLVDEFCASVPFHLGNRTAPSPPDKIEGVEYPHLPDEDEHGARPFPPHAIGYATRLSRAEHARFAAASGGWLLIGPIRDILAATAPGPRDASRGIPPLLRHGQREWILEQLQRLGRIYRIPIPHDPSPSSTHSMRSSTRGASREF